ncbi:retropepsin-like aspartic protease [Methylobacterium sp. D53M]
MNNNVSSPTYKCLVDTGADYLQLPAHAAASIGINLNGRPLLTVSTAAGSTAMILYSGVDVQVEGALIPNHDVLFDTTNTMKCLCGRTALLTAFKIGFDKKNWYHT